jgi:hypothetical protein
MPCSETIVRGSAFILIAWGLYAILSHAQDIRTAVQYGLFASKLDPKYVALLVMVALFSVVIPLIAIVSGWGLFKFHSWARLLALSLSIVSFIFTMGKSLEFALRRFYYWNVTAAGIPEGSVIVYFNLWPTYVTVLVSGVLILILRWEPVKKLTLPNVKAANS